MISLRKVIAVSATSALALLGAASTATAQSSQSVITVNLKVNGPAPSTVTGYNVTSNCNFLQPTGTGTQNVTSGFPATGGTGTQVYSLTATSACIAGVAQTGTGGGNAAVSISIGGTVRASGSLGTGFTMTETQRTAVAAATTIDVTITYPSFTVKKVVVGEEPVAGYDYPMAAVCYYNNGIIYGKATFTLKSGASKTFGTADMAELTAGSTCHVTELGSNGAANVSIIAQPVETGALAIQPINLTSGSNPFFNATFSPSINPLFASGGFNPNGTTVTVTNGYVGDLIVSKVVVGDPKSNIAVYEINVSCNNNGPRESFLLKDRQSWIKTGIATGTSCLVSETRSDGATASYSDNSGDNATDGRVTIKGTASGCIDTRLSSFPDCRANVIVTNSYVVATTTAAPTTAAATTAATTAAPAAPAPVEEPEVLDESEETVG